MRILSFIFQYVRRYTGWGLIALVAILVFAGATAGMVSLIEPIFQEVLLASSDAPTPLGLGGAIPDDDAPEWVRDLDLKGTLTYAYHSLKRRFGITDETVVYFVPILFFIVFLLRSVGDFVSGYSFQHIGLGATTNMRNDLFSTVVAQSSHFHEEHPSGELVSRVVSDISVMQNAVSTRVLDLFQQSFTLVVLLWLLFTTNFRMATLCLLLAPIILFIIFRFGKGMRRTSHRSQERMAELTQLLTEAVRGHRIVKSFGMEEFESVRFEDATRRHLKMKLRSQIFAHASGPAVAAVTAAASAVFLIYAGKSVRAGNLTAPLLIQFLTNLLLLYDPIRKLNKVNLVLQEALAAAHRVADIVTVPNEITERTPAENIETVREGISFEGVTFAYGREAVLQGVDLQIRRGEVVALVGPSGAGKSTLVNLLPRFFDPDDGQVAIDGIDVRNVSLKSLRQQIGMVTQETVLFDESVRNNIAYGRADLPLDLVRQAAAAAYADEFVMSLPEGYETTIGEAGSQLSGGQRQRLAIARALLKNAPILILDEATSHLDTESEALVQKALQNLMKGRTTLVIAHRLSTIKKADRIVVMEAGRITEDGTHDQLLAHDGTYKRLYDMQFQDVD